MVSIASISHVGSGSFVQTEGQLSMHVIDCSALGRPAWNLSSVCIVVGKYARAESCSRRFNTSRDTRVTESTFVSIEVDDLNKGAEYRRINIFAKFIMKSTRKYMVPSRTITSRSGIPLPIVKALCTVRENIALSKTDTPDHAIAENRPSIDGVKCEHPGTKPDNTVIGLLLA